MLLVCLLMVSLLNLALCQDVSFQTDALADKKSCSALSKNDCLFYHEAIDKCNDVCQKKIKGNDQDDNKKPDDNENKGKGKKGKKSNDNGGGAGCFHGDEMVVTNLGLKRMADLPLEPDVQVMSRDVTGQLSFSPIRYWMHSDAERTNDFVTLTTDRGQNLTLTLDHLIYETDCKKNEDARPVFAGRVSAGKCLLVQQGLDLVESRVVSRHVAQKQGVYAPITQNGNLVVNGVLVSSFCCVENERVQKLIFDQLDVLIGAARWLAPKMLVEKFTASRWALESPLETVFWFWDVSKSFIL